MAVETPTLDTLLLELRRTDGLLSGAQAALDLAIATVQEDHRSMLNDLTRKRDELLKAVFCEVQRLPVGESQGLTHGELAHKQLPAHIELDRPEEEMVRQLREAGRYDALVETVTLSRQALARLSEETLAGLGVRLVQRRQLVVKLPSGARFSRELP